MEDQHSKHLTTGDIARLYSVAPRTVSKWIDSGMLKGWKVPGSNDRRVCWDDMIAFSAEHGMKPTKPFKILYIEPNESLIYPRVVCGFLRLLGMNAEMVHCLPGAESFALGAELPTAAIVNVDAVKESHLDILVKHCKDTGVPLLGIATQMTTGQVEALKRRGINVIKI